MRVIAGKARRLALKTVPGMETRPTTDRIKESRRSSGTEAGRERLPESFRI